MSCSTSSSYNASRFLAQRDWLDSGLMQAIRLRVAMRSSDGVSGGNKQREPEAFRVCGLSNRIR